MMARSRSLSLSLSLLLEYWEGLKCVSRGAGGLGSEKETALGSWSGRFGGVVVYSAFFFPDSASFVPDFVPDGETTLDARFLHQARNGVLDVLRSHVLALPALRETRSLALRE